MNHPKLKHPKLCRPLPYIVVLGCGLLPIFIVFSLPTADIVRVIVIFGSLFGLLFYLFRNFMVLMMMDMALAMLSCLKTARKQYVLPPGRTPEAIRRSILRYGTGCDPRPLQPQPAALRYKFSAPLTVYSRGIERVVAAYEVDLLDGQMYRDIFSSAKTNSKALTGRKKAIFLDPQQKKQALHRVTVILILAHKVDPQMKDLYELVCKQCGDEQENCFVPCVVDLAQRTCVFNCVRVPYIGLGYAVKNRGIRIIKNRVFGGDLNLRGSQQYLDHIQDMDPETSLWDFWKGLRHEIIGAQREVKRRFEGMSEREILVLDDTLYLKWDQRGVCQSVELDAENKIAKVETVTKWAYPKAQPIGKKIIRKIEDHISEHYAKQGYITQFVDTETVT